MTIKQSYRLVTQANGEIARKLYENWCKKFLHIGGNYSSSFFHIIYHRVMEGNKGVTYGGWTVMVSLIGIGCFASAYFVCGMDPYLTVTCSFVLFFVCGCGVTMIAVCKPDYLDHLEVEKYVETVCSLLWNLIDYETISYEDGSSSHVKFPEHEIRLILYGNDLESLVKRVDGMLVHYAFIVRRVEGVKNEGDPGLLKVRNERRTIHEQAVALGLADKNPQTYFDRAIPAAQAVAKAPVPAS